MSNISRACICILNDYIANPFLWPRETDLVVAIVSKLQSITGYASRSVVKDAAGNKLSINLPTSLVRTEVKLLNSNERIDVCTLKDPPTLFCSSSLHERDILLKVDPADVDEILEVKLDPQCKGYWISDIDKLIRMYCYIFNEKRSLHLLTIDNHINVHRPGHLPNQRKIKNGAGSWQWPLESSKDFIINRTLNPWS